MSNSVYNPEFHMSYHQKPFIDQTSTAQEFENMSLKKKTHSYFQRHAHIFKDTLIFSKTRSYFKRHAHTFKDTLIFLQNISNRFHVELKNLRNTVTLCELKS